MGRYPELVIDLKKLRHNIKYIKNICSKNNIEVAGVIKGASGLYEIAKTFDLENLSFIASSRIEQLIPLKDKLKTPLMLIRIPGLSEVKDVIRYTDISLNSEIEVLKCLDQEAKRQNKKHEVILMKDLGDLREGFFEEKDIIEAALFVENKLDNLILSGIGTNLGCYGSVCATREKMEELVEITEKIEKELGRKLKYISGGATTSLPRLFDNDMPERINLLRIGEGILLAKDLKDLWGYNMDDMYQDVFTLKCEVIEVKDKPTYPVGEIFVDAFGNKCEYEDRGIRKRALLGIGKVDYVYLNDLVLKDKNIHLVGASSDHTIIDVEDKKDVKVGDIIEFNLSYSTMVYVTNSSNVRKTFI